MENSILSPGLVCVSRIVPDASSTIFNTAVINPSSMISVFSKFCHSWLGIDSAQRATLEWHVAHKWSTRSHTGAKH